MADTARGIRKVKSGLGAQGRPQHCLVFVRYASERLSCGGSTCSVFSLPQSLRHAPLADSVPSLQPTDMSSVSPQRLDSDSPHPYLVISVEEEDLWWIEYLPDGRSVVTGSRDKGTVRVWNLESGKQEGAPMECGGHVTDFAMTRDGTKIVSSGWDEGITVWDVESHKPVKEWTLSKTSIVAISPDDRFIAVGTDGFSVAIYSMEGRLVNAFEVGHFIWRMCFSPDGNKLACGTVDGIFVYDVASGTLILSPLDGFVTAFLWSHDGSRLFSTSHSTICCWNSDTGEQIGHPWTDHTYDIDSLSLSPDGTILASTSGDKTVRFWNATTGDPVGHLQHDGVSAVRFSPSGESVASAGLDGKIYIWRVVERLGQCQISNFKYVFPVA